MFSFPDFDRRDLNLALKLSVLVVKVRTPHDFDRRDSRVELQCAKSYSVRLALDLFSYDYSY